MVPYSWIFLSFSLPSEPSRIRVSLWRKLKKMGAVSLQSLWVLPASEANERFFSEIGGEIHAGGGDCMILSGEKNAENDRLILSKFEQARAEEYKELSEQCEKLLAELEKETASDNFTFAELEENEADLQKLESWMNRVKNRDFFASPSAADAETKLSECRNALGMFADNVYRINDLQE
jgi:vacuolar-type H+-ATPase subunit I/STV1